mgnify:FL=1
MVNSEKVSKAGNTLLFLILGGLGVLFLLAAPVDPLLMISRLIIGLVLISVSIILYVLVGIVIRKKRLNESIMETSESSPEDYSTIPDEIVCKNCDHRIELTNTLKSKDTIICEKCGEKVGDS